MASENWRAGNSSWGWTPEVKTEVLVQDQKRSSYLYLPKALPSPWTVTERYFSEPETDTHYELIHIDYMKGAFALEAFMYICEDMIFRWGYVLDVPIYINTIASMAIRQSGHRDTKYRSGPGYTSMYAYLDFIPLNQESFHVAPILRQFKLNINEGVMLVPPIYGEKKLFRETWYMVSNFYLPKPGDDYPALS